MIAEALPWPQGVQPTPAEGLYEPAPQSAQPEESALFSSPIPQSTQEAVDVPAVARYLPWSQVVQTEAPAEPMYLPTLQSTQAAMLEEPGDGLLLPAMQSGQAPPAAFWLYLPASQSMQSVRAVELGEEVVLPAMQETQFVLSAVLLHLPRGQCSQDPPAAVTPEPTGHILSEVQAVLSSFDRKEPPQAVQDVSPGEEVYVAPVHSVQTEARPEMKAYLPEMQSMQSSGESWRETSEASSLVDLPEGQAVQDDP